MTPRRNPGAVYFTKMILSSLFLVVLSGCAATEDENGETNRLSGVAVCANVVDDRCPADEAEFSARTETIYITATVTTAVPGTEARATLTRVDGETREKILSYSVGIDPEDDGENTELVFFFDNSGNTTDDGAWTEGEYEVEVAVHAADKEPVRKTIQIR
jgi:hypothetical protein